MGRKSSSRLKIGLSGLVVAVLFAPLAVLGQAATPDCSPEAHALILDQYAGLIRGAGADVGEQLTAMQTDLAALDAACAGLAFQGDKGGVVIGPVEIPTGVYRLRLTGSSLLSVTSEALDGQCGLFFIGLTDASGGTTEKIFRSENCRMLLQINGDKPWSLTFTAVQ